MLGIPFDICNLDDCNNVLSLHWSSQAEVVFSACLINGFFQLWKMRNLFQFEDNNIKWKTCATYIVAHAKLVVNLTSKCSNSTIQNFVLLKNFDINIRPSAVVRHVYVVWYPPPIG